MLDVKERTSITVGSTVRIETSKDPKKSNITFGIIEKILSDEDYAKDGHLILLDDGKTKGRVIEIIHFIPSVMGHDQELILKGENDKVEFKQSFSFDVKKFQNTGIKERLEANEFNIPKAVCGFANSFGGTLFIGIEDKTKKIIGLQNDYDVLNVGDDGFENAIKMTLRKFFGEDKKWIFKNIEMKMLHIQGKDIFKIKVTPSKAPFIIEKKVSTENDKFIVPYFFVRTGNGTENFTAQSFIEYWLTHLKKI
jgi:uncharacterized protein YwbE